MPVLLEHILPIQLEAGDIFPLERWIHSELYSSR